MALRVVWTETATEDLRGIVEFIAADSPDAARRLAEAILAKIEHLQQFPRMGRTVPEKGDPAIREVILSPYRIIYHLRQGRGVLHVARIWHAARGTPDV